MKSSGIMLAGITLILFMVGCSEIEPEKDDLTKPARFLLNIGLTKETYENYDGLIDWGGQINIQSIRFEGKRETGEDIFFETDPEMYFQPINLTNPAKPFCTFDIPRGIYTYMKFEMNLKKIVTQTSNDFFDLDSMNIGFYLSGGYDYWEYWEDETLHPVVFAVDDTVKLTIQSGENFRHEFLKGYEDRTYRIFLIMNPHGVFDSISQDSIRKLETSMGSWGKIFLISSSKNENLYNDLLYKVIRSMHVN